MPPILPPAGQYLAGLLGGLSQGVAASASGGTAYVVDPSVTNPSATNPNCMVIVGNVTKDNFGNSTGLPSAAGKGKWGIATYNSSTKAWTQL